MQRNRQRLRHFLLIFDHKKGALLRPPQEFEDAQEAIAAYSRTEREYEGREDMEIVLIGSDSLATVKRTHANYFAGDVASKYLRGL